MGPGVLSGQAQRESLCFYLQPLSRRLWPSRARRIGRDVASPWRSAGSIIGGAQDSARGPASDSGRYRQPSTQNERPCLGHDQGPLRLAYPSLADLSVVVSPVVPILRVARSQSPPFDVVFPRGSKFIAACGRTSGETGCLCRSGGHLLFDAGGT